MDENMKTVTAAGCILLITIFCNNVFAAPLSDSDMIDILTQSVCLDRSGKPTTQIPYMTIANP